MRTVRIDLAGPLDGEWVEFDRRIFGIRSSQAVFSRLRALEGAERAMSGNDDSTAVAAIVDDVMEKSRLLAETLGRHVVAASDLLAEPYQDGIQDLHAAEVMAIARAFFERQQEISETMLPSQNGSLQQTAESRPKKSKKRRSTTSPR